MITITKKETYRSEGRQVNMVDDKMRITIDMDRIDWPKLRKLLVNMENTEVQFEDDV